VETKREQAAQYQELKEKLEGLAQTRAEVVARETIRAQERGELENKLQAKGINLEDLDGERERLKEEFQQMLDRAETELAEVEKDLQGLDGTLKSPNKPEKTSNEAFDEIGDALDDGLDID